MSTLLIIDMQQAWLARTTNPCADVDGVVARINHAAAQVRAQGGEVIFIQHSDPEAPIDTDGWQILPALHREPGDGYVRKLACDSFAGTDLAAQVSGETLYIAGFATEFCVDSTVRAAASLGYRVAVLADAHTTSDRPHLDAKSIIAHHNWVWSSMDVPAGASILVEPTASLFPG